MVFTTRVGSTAQKLKMELLWQNEYSYQEVYERLQSAVIRFSMIDEKTGKYKIANRPATLEVRKADYGYAGKELLYIVYSFSNKDLDVANYYRGEFGIKFLDCDEVLFVPVKEKLYINVLDSLGSYQ